MYLPRGITFLLFEKVHSHCNVVLHIPSEFTNYIAMESIINVYYWSLCLLLFAFERLMVILYIYVYFVFEKCFLPI